MNGYAIMAIAGGIVWAVMTVVYIMKFKQGIRARKWFGVIAYMGLACLIGGGLEYFKPLMEKVSPIWVMIPLIIFIYLTAKVYILNNIER